MQRTVPPLFYKYTPIESWLPSLLSGDSILFSARDSFNDPFDSRPAFKVTLDTVEGRKFFQGKLKQHTKLSPSKRIAHLQKTARLQENMKPDDNEGIKLLLDNAGILSLATSWENPLMWAHYAKHHQGICISFKSNMDIFRFAFEVNYQDDLPIILRPQDSASEMIDKTFLAKSKCWEYEHEWRVIKVTSTQEEKNLAFSKDKEMQKIMMDCNGPGIYKFDCNSIESVTIGMRSSKQDEEFVKDAMINLNHRIPLYRAKPSPLKYNIERELLGVY